MTGGGSTAGAGSPWRAYQRPQDHLLDDAGRAELLAAQLECVVAWAAPAGWPVAVVHWFLWREDRFWVTAAADRPRVEALRQRPQSSVVVSGAGTLPGSPRSVSARTLATVHDDGRLLASWFAAELAAKAHGSGNPAAARFEQMLRETSRVVLELAPVAWTSYDAGRLQATLQRQRADQPPGAPPDRPTTSRSQ